MVSRRDAIAIVTRLLAVTMCWWPTAPRIRGMVVNALVVSGLDGQTLDAFVLPQACDNPSDHVLHENGVVVRSHGDEAFIVSLQQWVHRTRRGRLRRCDQLFDPHQCKVASVIAFR